MVVMIVQNPTPEILNPKPKPPRPPHCGKAELPSAKLADFGIARSSVRAFGLTGFI